MTLASVIELLRELDAAGCKRPAFTLTLRDDDTVTVRFNGLHGEQLVNVQRMFSLATLARYSLAPSGFVHEVPKLARELIAAVGTEAPKP